MQGWAAPRSEEALALEEKALRAHVSQVRGVTPLGETLRPSPGLGLARPCSSSLAGAKQTELNVTVCTLPSGISSDNLKGIKCRKTNFKGLCSRYHIYK